MRTTGGGTAELDAGLLLLREINEGKRVMTVGGDKAYVVNNFINPVRESDEGGL